MKELSKNYVGLLLGGLMALFHLTWSALVLVGVAKVLLDWILWLHFMSIPITIEPFDLVRAALLVLVTFTVGYVVGWVSAWLWNMLIKTSK